MRLRCFVVFLAMFTPSAMAQGMDSGVLFDRAEAAAGREFEALKGQGLPGMLVGMAVGSGESRRRAFGASNLKTGAPLKRDHTMRIGSVAKLVVATVVLQLVDEGRLRLDDPVSKYVAGVPHGDAITLRMLGRHRSGLFNPLADPAFRMRLNANPGVERTVADIMAILRRHAASVVPNATFSYSNANTILLAQAVESVTGGPVSDAIDSRIRRRFGVSTPVIPVNAEFPDADLRGYRFGARAGAIEYGEVFFDATDFSASWAGAAGNMNALLGDLLVLTKPLAAGTTLSKKSRAALHDFETVAPGFDYGFHVARYGDAIGHAGDVPGFSSFLAWIPRLDLSVVVLCNLSNLADKRAPATIVGKRIIEALRAPRDQR